MSSSNELLAKTERLKVILIAHATHDTDEHTSDEEYVELRRELVSSPLLREKLPRFVINCRSLREFWGFIQPKFEHYKDRREYLREEFKPLLDLLELESFDVPSPAIGDSFEHQFPAGLPFGLKKPSLAFIPLKGSQKAAFEDEPEVGVIRKDVYPNLAYHKLEDHLRSTPIGQSGFFILNLRRMCQTRQEKQFLASYEGLYKILSENVPILIPQAWIQWHSKPKRDLRAVASSYTDDLYRVDSVSFWKNRRFAILVDDISHYAKHVGTRWDADEQKYAMRLKEDRKLRKEGWQVFRVGNWEIRAESFIAEILNDLREYIDF